MIMIGKLVHGNLERRCRKTCHMVPHSPHKAIRISIQVPTVIIAMLLHARKEPCYWLHKSIIVHYRVPFLSIQPIPRASIMLGKNNSIWICLSYSFTKLFPKMMIKFRTMPQVRGNVQTPSIRVIRRRNPFSCNPKDIIK
jgi:hypothetical protein